MEEKQSSNIWTHKRFVRLFFIVSLLTTLFIFGCTESSNVTPVGPSTQPSSGSTSSEIPNNKEDVEGAAVNVEEVIEDPVKQY